ncbi:MAG: hypothetical protein CR958_00210 [Rhodobacterales bacterium]|nr:MAG: hypothetical protein CR958_00210 [Rhodobacterales bacterium]
MGHPIDVSERFAQSRLRGSIIRAESEELPPDDAFGIDAMKLFDAEATHDGSDIVAADAEVASQFFGREASGTGWNYRFAEEFELHRPHLLFEEMGPCGSDRKR